jgi:membrane protein YdbS with pleckstrin-like domain
MEYQELRERVSSLKGQIQAIVWSRAKKLGMLACTVLYVITGVYALFTNWSGTYVAILSALLALLAVGIITTKRPYRSSCSCFAEEELRVELRKTRKNQAAENLNVSNLIHF